MGQQQLLLLLVAVILIGLAIVIVVKLFDVNALEANRDAVYIDTVSLIANAQHYYQLPRMLSGGGGSFVGYTLPEELVQNENGTYTVSNVTESSITITGVGNEQDPDGRSYQVTTIATPTAIQSTTSVLQ